LSTVLVGLDEDSLGSKSVESRSVSRSTSQI
jgi:hypothetical protein